MTTTLPAPVLPQTVVLLDERPYASTVTIGADHGVWTAEPVLLPIPVCPLARYLGVAT